MNCFQMKRVKEAYKRNPPLYEDSDIVLIIQQEDSHSVGVGSDHVLSSDQLFNF